jgi:hypothetical protein
MSPRLNLVLLSLLGSHELVMQWWESKNKAFDNETPSDMFAKDPQRVIQYIKGQLNSDYS